MSPSASDHWLIADIGGTHARLARWHPHHGLTDAVRVANDDYATPDALLRAFVAQFSTGPRRAVLALAMPIDRDTESAQLTNRPWTFSSELLQALQWDELQLTNDFVAAAAGVESLPADAFEHVCGPRGVEPSMRLVLGPGTGLGAAAVSGSEVPPRIIASEAGHMTFASARDGALATLGLARWPRVSWERVICGDGLAWLDALERADADPQHPAQVAARAIAGEAAAVRAVARFSRLLGEFAGDACLAFAAFGGVSLCGGVLEGLSHAFDRQQFEAGFVAKGRFEDRLHSVGCRRVVDGHDIGLLGLAHYLNGGCVIPVKRWAMI